MMPDYKKTIGTKQKPLELKTPPGTSSYTLHIDEKDGKEVLVCTVGTTVLHYDPRCIEDLATMLKQHGDWMLLGSVTKRPVPIQPRSFPIQNLRRIVKDVEGRPDPFGWVVCRDQPRCAVRVAFGTPGPPEESLRPKLAGWLPQRGVPETGGTTRSPCPPPRTH